MKRNKQTSKSLEIQTMTALVISIFLIFVSIARAERPNASNPNSWLTNMGSIGFDGSGGYYLPGSVLLGLRDGQFSALQQVFLTAHIIDSCAENLLKEDKRPKQKEAYVKADKKFTEATCEMTACFQQAMAQGILAELRESLKNTPSQERDKILGQVALSLYSSMKNKHCEGTGYGFDPMLFVVLGGLSQN